MRTFFTVILIAIAAAAGFYIYQQSQPQPQPQSETVTQALPDEISKIAAKKHIEQLTQTAEDAIQIGQADHFVTDKQLLQIPEKQLHSDASLEAASNENAATFAVDLGGIRSSSDKVTQEIIIRKDLFSQGNGHIKLQELLNDPDNTQGKVFYIHAVNNNDKQGLWGIIQSGLINTFARGIEIKQNVLSAAIPQTADERQDNSRSSFLGTILNNKVKDTYVYNYEKGILGQNPDLITPGQELIIVTFTEDELINIYNHFVAQ